MQITVTYNSLEEFLKYHHPKELPLTKEDVGAPEAAKTVAVEPAAVITKTDIRAVALRLSKAGKSDELRAVFSKFGAERLSDIKEEDYPAVMAELGEINA